MKAVVVEAFGGPEVMQLKDVPMPEPLPGEVLVEVACSTVNPVDWKTRDGNVTRIMDVPLPIIPGWDVAGTVVALGDGVTRFAIGDEVYGLSGRTGIRCGAYAEYATLDSGATAKKPGNLTLEQAACTPLAGLTAWQSLFVNAELKAGDTVLIQGGAGGTGSFALQFAKHAGAKSIYTTARSVNHDYVRGLGADVAIDYTLEDFTEAMRRHEPDGVDMVWDSIGGEVHRRSFEVLKPGGVISLIIGQTDPQLAGRYGVKDVVTFVQGSVEQLEKMAEMFEQGSLSVPEYTVMPLDDIVEAHSRSETLHVRGKIVLKIK